MNNIIAGIVLSILFSASVISGYLYISDIPDVYISHSTGMCQKVIYYEEGKERIKTCDKLPNKYNVIWVK